MSTRYIYVDLGAYDGDSIRYFMQGKNFEANGYHYSLPVEPHQFEIYAFEPNPRFTSQLGGMKEQFPNIVTVSTDIAWVENGTSEFTIDTNDLAFGSTIMKTKRNWGQGDVVEKQTFDFSEWVVQFQDDYLIVKMDIEGAEFPVIEKMIEDNTDLLVNQLWVEFHPNKVRDYTTTDMQDLISRLRCPVEVWH